MPASQPLPPDDRPAPGSLPDSGAESRRQPDIVLKPAEAPLLGRPIPGLHGRDAVQQVIHRLLGKKYE